MTLVKGLSSRILNLVATKGMYPIFAWIKDNIELYCPFHSLARSSLAREADRTSGLVLFISRWGTQKLRTA